MWYCSLVGCWYGDVWMWWWWWCGGYDGSEKGVVAAAVTDLRW
ncbi:hypothetical protein A2U01_0067678, partial [Trifolium medium]|nr:hypothetical protein [Trifolium medium]